MSSTENNTEQKQENTTEDDGLSAINIKVLASNHNKRISPRYIRDDIVVVLCEVTPFSFGKEIFIDFVKLHDITSRGISFLSSRYLTVQKKLVLNLMFHSEKSFKIPATIVYRINRKPYQYGMKFDFDNNELGDYLLTTQSNLRFR